MGVVICRCFRVPSPLRLAPIFVFPTATLIRPVDDPNRSYSITNPWGLVRGAFAFVKR